MIVVKANITGLGELKKKFQELPLKVENQILQKATTASLMKIKPEMIEAAPAHMDEQSPASKIYGPIKKNIRVIKLKNLRRGQKGARLDTGNAFWAFFYEKGTRHQPARPWFLPRFTALIDNVVDTVSDQITEGIEKMTSLK